MNTIARPRLLSNALPNLFAFCFGLGAAYVLKWNTAELVWSLWISSLVVGWLTLLCALTGAGLTGFRVIRNADAERPARIFFYTAGIGSGLFFLTFFAFHFCGFHAGHAVFLSSFFPLPGIEPETFTGAFANPPKLLAIAATRLLPLFWPFVIASIIVERRHLWKPITEAASFEPRPPGAEETGGEKLPAGKKHNALAGAVGRPYLNVVRMHFLIFFFAGASALQIASFPVYATVYILYFFPWNMLTGVFNRPSEPKGTDTEGHASPSRSRGYRTRPQAARNRRIRRR